MIDVEKTKLALNVLNTLASFNQLNERMVNVIGQTFGIDVNSLCKENGITFHTHLKDLISRETVLKTVEEILEKQLNFFTREVITEIYQYITAVDGIELPVSSNTL